MAAGGDGRPAAHAQMPSAASRFYTDYGHGAGGGGGGGAGGRFRR